MKPTQAELILRVAENTWADNDDRLNKVRLEMTEGARQILDDEQLLTKAWEINQRDKARFAAYMPPEERQRISQAATHMSGQAATGRTLADQRAALAPVKKAENG